MLKLAYQLGVQLAYEEAMAADLEKTAMSLSGSIIPGLSRVGEQAGAWASKNMPTFTGFAKRLFSSGPGVTKVMPAARMANPQALRTYAKAPTQSVATNVANMAQKVKGSSQPVRSYARGPARPTMGATPSMNMPVRASEMGAVPHTGKEITPEQLNAWMNPSRTR